MEEITTMNILSIEDEKMIETFKMVGQNLSVIVALSVYIILFVLSIYTIKGCYYNWDVRNYEKVITIIFIVLHIIFMIWSWV